MKRSFLALALALVIAGSSYAQTNWIFDRSHTHVGFSVGYMMVSEVEGSFGSVYGNVTSKGDDFKGASVDIQIDATTIYTADDGRDKHLKSADFFDVTKYPNLLFKSTSLDINGKSVTLKGNLTIKNVTKPVVLKGNFGGVQKDPWGNTKAGFTLTGKINRQDFNVNWNKNLDGGGVVVGDEVDLIIKAVLIKK